MTYYFLDSSALIKRYIPETGTNWLRNIVMPVNGNTVIVAEITSVEIVSGVSRRKREGQISVRTAYALRILIDRHANREYMVVGLGRNIIQQSENLLELHPLRAYDSVQLASAVESNTRLLAAGLTPLIFLSSDQQLLTAATNEGLAVDDPNLHP
jgi:predicted nucleic acid-binding protein